MPCDASAYSKVLALVNNDQNFTSSICNTYDLTSLSAAEAVLSATVAQLQAVQGTLADTSEQLVEAQYGLNTFWVLLCGALVFIMQVGFAMFVAGVVRSKNMASILMKSFIDTVITALCFYATGYGFARGVHDPANAFAGNSDFALSATTGASPAHFWQLWLWEWVFCAASATIMAGAVAERGTFISYTIWVAFYALWVYPVVAYWSWDASGWLSAANPNAILNTGAIDFAGSGVVHTQGGFASLVAAIIIGPRVGRYDANVNVRLFKGGHSPALYLMGTFLLWLGWYGFNPGSTLAVNSYLTADTAARTAVTTTLAASAGGLASLLLVYWRTHTWDMLSMCTGVLGGLVAITAGCAVVEPWAAVICGLVSAPFVVFGDDLMDRLQIDDPAQAFPMHGMSGIWGVVFVGLLAKEQYVDEVYGKGGHHRMGIFYGGHGQLLLCQVIAVLVVVAWVSFWSGLFFWIMKKLHLHRVQLEDEAVGLDAAAMGDQHGSNMMPNMTKIYYAPTQSITAMTGGNVLLHRALGPNLGGSGSNGHSSHMEGSGGTHSDSDGLHV